MQPISQKVGGPGGKQTSPEVQKSAPSKFDLLRADLNQKLSGDLQLPPKITSVDDQQKAVLENDLRRKLQAGQSPRSILGAQLSQIGTQIADLNHQVSGITNASGVTSLRSRLESVESDFNASAKLLRAPGDLSDPNRLLDMQMQMYKLTQNVEILSRVVGDTASGVKTILQTQV